MRCEQFNDVVDVEVLRARTVRLTFETGEVRELDLTPLLWGPAFAAIADDDDLFAQLAIDRELGTIVWPNGADISPATLYRHSEPAARAS